MIEISDALMFKEILRKMGQHSPIIKIQKTRDELIISSTSTDELSFASVILKEAFFEKWNGRNESIIEIESKTLYDVSKIIQTESKVIINLSDNSVQFDIGDTLKRKITICGLKTEPKTFEPRGIEKVKTKLKIESKVFRRVIGELNNLLDEAQLFFRKDSGDIIFSGKQRGLTLDIILQERDLTNSNIEENILVEFPVKHLQHFSTLVYHFKDLLLSFAPTNPFIIEGCNKKWKLFLMVSKIDKNIGLRGAK